MVMMKKRIAIIIELLAIFSVAIFSRAAFARQIIVNENSESMIMLDVARRYYSVDEIKLYIDALSKHENSTIQLHFTDDENVGIECIYLDQTKANATFTNNIYTNPATGKPFLSYDQVNELMAYADSKNVRFVPEIDIPAHMTGFTNLAEIKFGHDFVHDPTTGIAWKPDTDYGNVDFVHPAGHDFIINLYDEYSDFFASREYFHMGFDEYTLRTDEKIDFINEVYEYLANKGYKVRMWSDAVTTNNINRLNKNIEIVYWGWWDDVSTGGYASVPDFQEAGFKLLITNRWYLFFVPSVTTVTPENNAHTIRDIEENWQLESWNYNFPSTLDNHNNILGGAVCIWGENSAGVSDQAIREQGIAMYEAMFKKLDVNRRIIEIPDENNDKTDGSAVNPATEDQLPLYIISIAICAIILIICIVAFAKGHKDKK